jgi:hypothetical protein
MCSRELELWIQRAGRTSLSAHCETNLNHRFFIFSFWLCTLLLGEAKSMLWHQHLPSSLPIILSCIHIFFATRVELRFERMFDLAGEIDTSHHFLFLFFYDMRKTKRAGSRRLLWLTLTSTLPAPSIARVPPYVTSYLSGLTLLRTYGA